MIKFRIERVQNDVAIAAELIRKTCVINDFKFNLNIVFDWHLKECGIYYPIDNPYELFINLDNCKLLENFKDNNDLFYLGYTKDYSAVGILVHEFAHFITYKVFVDMKSRFKKVFPTTRLYLNDYSNENIDEEIAETLYLYIVNPYLLRLISKSHYEFFKSYLKSPVPCTSRSFQKIYHGFPYEIKEQLKTKWGIVFDVDKNKFEKFIVENIK